MSRDNTRLELYLQATRGIRCTIIISLFQLECNCRSKGQIPRGRQDGDEAEAIWSISHFCSPPLVK
jgi:hypothetical protein